MNLEVTFTRTQALTNGRLWVDLSLSFLNPSFLGQLTAMDAPSFRVVCPVFSYSCLLFLVTTPVLAWDILKHWKP